MNWENTDEVKTWLESLPREVMLAFAQRAAQYMLPHTFVEVDKSPPFSHSASSLALPVLRVGLSSEVACIWQLPDIISATRGAQSIVDVTQRHTFLSLDEILFATKLALQATLEAKNASKNATISILHTMIAAVFDTRFSTRETMRASLNAHKAWIDAQGAPTAFALHARPLWASGKMPEDIANAWARFLDTAPDEIWGFWKRWYQGVLDGQPLDWDLQKRVALIDPEIWEQGPEAVAAAIAEIEGEFSASVNPKSNQSQLAKVQNALRDQPDEIEAYLTSLKAMITDQINALEMRKPNVPDALQHWQDGMNFLRRLLATVTHLEDAVQRFAQAHDKETAAQNTLSLVDKYKADIIDWPDKNREKVVDGTFRAFPFISCLGLCGLLGVPAPHIAMAATAYFSGPRFAKEIGQAIRGDG